MKKIVIAMALIAAFGAKADTLEDISRNPQVKITTDPTRTFIYVKSPKRLLFDDNEKQAAVTQIDQLIQSQFKKLSSVNVSDPDGDLAAINASLTSLHKQVDLLVDTASLMNNQLQSSIKLLGIDANPNPSALLVFAGVELEGYAKLLSAGGSLMLGVSIMPMQVDTYRVDTREKVGAATEYDMALIVIPNGNVGVGASTNAMTGNPRSGIGLVWGPLNSASEVTGLAYGGSATWQALGKGVNVKAMGLKNVGKPGAINNVLVLAGVEGAFKGPQGVQPTVNFFGAEAHFGIAPILDATPLVKKVASLIPSTSDSDKKKDEKKTEKKSDKKTENKNDDN